MNVSKTIWAGSLLIRLRMDFREWWAIMRGKKKVAIFTGNRAEYGLQYPIIKAISKHPKLAYFLLVSGAHLDERFGYTKKEIEKDGFKVYGEIKADVKADNLAS